MKPSRLAPSVPMHMKTRGSQKALSVMSGSVSGDSRRSSISRSLNGVGQSGDDIDQPAKRQRLSRESSIRRSSHSSNSSDGKASISKTPKLATFSTTTESISSAKRKHSDADDDDQDQQPVDDTKAATTQQDEAADSQFLDVPLRKRLGRPPKKSKITPVVSDNAAPPAKRPPGRPPRLGRLPLGRQVSERMAQRIPGRRRKPNPDAELEADLGRLAELRRNYRILAKMVKPAIAELAERAITDIENDPEAHKRTPQYQLVQDELDARFNQRIALIEREYQLKVQYERKVVMTEEECIRMNFQVCLTRRFHCECGLTASKRTIRDIQEKYITESKHQMMESIRCMEAVEDNEATEDEVRHLGDDLKVLLLFIIIDSYQSEPEDGPATPRSLLRDVSRSVFPIETERKWKALEARAGVAKLLEIYAPGLVEDMRRYEQANRQNEERADVELENIRKLASATTVVDATTGVSGIGNSAMNALAELSTRLLEVEPQVSNQGKPTLPAPNEASSSGVKAQAMREHPTISTQPVETTFPSRVSSSGATSEAVMRQLLSPAKPPDTLPTPTLPSLDYSSLRIRENTRLSVEPMKALPPLPKDSSVVKKHGEDEFAERRLRLDQGRDGENNPSTTTTRTAWQATSSTGKYGDSATSPLHTSRVITSNGGSPSLSHPIQQAMGSLDGAREDSALTNYQRPIQPLRPGGLAPLHTSPRGANMDFTISNHPGGATGLGKQTTPVLSPVAKSTGRAQSIVAKAIPPASPYVSPYGPMNEQARPHIAVSTTQAMSVAQQLTRPSPTQVTGAAQIPTGQAQQPQQVPPTRRRELRPAPSPAMAPPLVYPRYPQDSYFGAPAYGYPEAEAGPHGRTPEGFYGYVPPYDPMGGQGYYPSGPYMPPPQVQPLQYPTYLMYNPPPTQSASPGQPSPHQQGPAHLQPAFAGQPRIAPSHTIHSAPVPPPQRPLTFQYYQPPGGNQPGPSQSEQSRR
ncbi:hypothetical protein GP486_004121 [Trichoglossum hirsutum]|uniref:Uncharacterized protein n=1 Tax=Trichoglossum hirsutum TaxID=265104 RepID=A0A9P8RPL3_9PEZI|nr:hypothetical protein GP486_004121 [Trichoglossum hirsutum]